MTAKKSKKTKSSKSKKASVGEAAEAPVPATKGAVSPSESPAARNPFAAMRRLSDEMEQLFRGAGVGDILSLPSLRDSEAAGLWGPDVDILERKGQLIIRADLPGLDKDDVKVEIADSSLTIAGERKSERKEEKEGYYRSERSYGSFSRTIQLPEGAKTDKAKASFKDGVLEVTMPKASKKKPGRRVTVKL